jgi:hypothetical protein
LRTCRQIYAETALLLYKCNSFYTYEDILDGGRQLPAHAMMRITHAQIRIAASLRVDDAQRLYLRELAKYGLNSHNLQLFPNLRRLLIAVYVQVDKDIPKTTLETFLSEQKEEFGRYIKERKEEFEMDFYFAIWHRYGYCTYLAGEGYRILGRD